MVSEPVPLEGLYLSVALVILIMGLSYLIEFVREQRDFYDRSHHTFKYSFLDENGQFVEYWESDYEKKQREKAKRAAMASIQPRPRFYVRFFTWLLERIF